MSWRSHQFLFRMTIWTSPVYSLIGVCHLCPAAQLGQLVWTVQSFVGNKIQIQRSDILTEPSAVPVDPPPRPETNPDQELQSEVDNRLHRDAAAIRRVGDANIERRKKGPRIGMNCFFFHEAEARAGSSSFCSWERRKKESGTSNLTCRP